MTEEQEDQGGSRQYLTFTIGTEGYAVEVSSVEVVLELPVITRVPRSAPHLRGVVNHRGSVIPVVDLRRLLGLDPSDSSGSVIVTQVNYENERLTAGILADSVQEVIELDEGLIEAPPDVGVRSGNVFINGIAKHHDAFIILLDLDVALDPSSLSEKRGDAGN